ncbi:MAG: hypothetical protein AAF125_14860 [Chloroflexota bacterium]
MRAKRDQKHKIGSFEERSARRLQFFLRWAQVTATVMAVCWFGLVPVALVLINASPGTPGAVITWAVRFGSLSIYGGFIFAGLAVLFRLLYTFETATGMVEGIGRWLERQFGQSKRKQK